MIAAFFSVIAMIALILILGFGALATLVGAVVTVIALPDDCTVELPRRAAGIACTFVGLIVFYNAVTLIIAVAA